MSGYLCLDFICLLVPQLHEKRNAKSLESPLKMVY